VSVSAPSQAFFLVGPTAVGKSSVAQYLAEQRGSAILSADSMLIYRGMDIGTATPSVEERGDISYYGLNLADPSDLFSVWDYRCSALDAVRKLPADQELIVVGGTGLYVKSLTHGLVDRAGVNLERRQHWERRFEDEGIGVLQAALQEGEPATYDSLSDKQNPRRLIRALESMGSGLPIHSWNDITPEPIIVGLSMDPQALNARIAQRVADMYDQGLIQEVEQLLRLKEPLSKTARQAIGYSEAIDVIEGRMTPAEAVDRTVVRTRRLAKRQRTWFRHQANVESVEVTPQSTVESVAAAVTDIWRKYGPTTIQSE
jgi:tRNA dimethylallyltransferase